MEFEREVVDLFRCKRVLVTGGAGFIGSHLVETLVHAGAQVRVLDDLSSGDTRNLEAVTGRIELVVGDIRDAALCRQVAEDQELIFHQAAMVSVLASQRDPARTLSVNLIGTSNLFTAARSVGVARVIYASSCAVYGDCATQPLTESCVGRMLSAYAVSKRTCELLSESEYANYGLSSVGLRYANVYGPRQRAGSPYSAVIPIFFEACRKGQSPVIYGDGSQTRDFVHVEDVVRANLAAAIAPKVDALTLNVSTGIVTSIRSLAEMLCALTVPSIAPSYAPARAGDIAHSAPDPARAESLLGFRARVDLQSGLARLAATWTERG